MKYNVFLRDKQSIRSFTHFRFWKATCVFLAVFLVNICVVMGYAQNISISMRGASLDRLLEEIKDQSGYKVLYTKAHASAAEPVDLEFNNQPLEQVLDAYFAQQPLTYTIRDKTIIVKRSPKRQAADPIEIQGLVTGSQGEPLEGVSIRLKGTQIYTVSGSDGTFHIRVPQNQGTLEFRYIGYSTKEVQLDGSTRLTVTLVEALNNLDEVVVVGYGEVNRRDLTGSVGSVSVTDLQKAPVRSFEEALAGRVAGVQVNSQDGQPGAGIDIVIRGANSLTQSNSPLYVIDGFIMEDPESNAINPSDIESIEVLKDASSTAIYGARGANGVIIITTKSGKEGKPDISYDGYYGTQEVLQRMDVMSPYEFIKFHGERSAGTTRGLYFLDEDGNEVKTLEDYRGVEGVDWQARIFEVAPMQSHNLSLRGGTETTKYSLSGSIFDQDGVIINSGYDRKQGRLRLDQKVTDRFKVSANINYSNLYRYGTSPGGSYNRTLLYSAWGYRPVSGNSDIDLAEVEFDEEIDLVNSPRFNPILSAENELREYISDVLSVNGYGEYDFGDFKLKAFAGLNRNVRKTNQFNNTKTRSGSPRFPGAASNGVNGSIGYSERSTFISENTLTWSKRIDKHRITALGGVTFQQRTSNSFGANAIQIPNENLGVSGLDEGTPSSISSSSSHSNLLSFLARVNYDYQSKYLATFSFRSDGSSKFMKGNKFGYFPSGALSWRFSKEEFMKSLDFVSDAKLRASAGVTGNNRVSDFAYMSTIRLPNSDIYPFNNNIEKAAIPSELGNTNLLWENTFQADFGLDLALFEDRIALTADVYHKSTYDLLLYADLPPSAAYRRTYKNIGKVSNQGLEIELNTVNIQSENFTWTSSFNISFNRNTINQLAENQEAMLSTISWHSRYNSLPLYSARIGQPIALFYGLIWDGNYQYEDFDQYGDSYVLKSTVTTNGNDRGSIRPGDIKYKDINGDRIVNADDYTVIGNPNPKHFGGFSNNFIWKGFDLNVFLQWSYGNDVYNANRLIFEGRGGVLQNQFSSYENRWTPENQNNVYHRTGGWGPYAYSSRVIEDGSFLRLKTVSLGYNVPQSISARLPVSHIRVYCSAQNLYTWTNYQGLDPEVSARQSALTPAFDYSVYPRARTITFGLNVSL